jgi:hypothetical protein
MHIQQFIFYHYLPFCADFFFLVGYEHSDDEDQDDQLGYSGPHKAPPNMQNMTVFATCRKRCKISPV